jgi:hypothetical protein
MKNFILTYDIESTNPDPHSKFIEYSERFGLLFVAPAGGHLKRLPNTTLWGKFETKEDCLDAVHSAITLAELDIGSSINLKKFLITKASDVKFESDVEKYPDRRWKKSTLFETCREHQLYDPDFSY